MFDKLRKLLGRGETPEPGQTGRIRKGASTANTATAARRPARARPLSADASKGAGKSTGKVTGNMGGDISGAVESSSTGHLGGFGSLGSNVSSTTGNATNQSGSPARKRAAADSALGLGAGPRAGLGSVDIGHELSQAELPCPNCGEPMLPGWGTTCGKCRPHLVPAKTMFLAAGQVALPAQAAGGMTLGWLVVIRSIDERQRGTLVELDRPRVILSRAGAAPGGVDRMVGFDDSYMSSAHAVIGRPLAGDRTDAFTIRDRENPASANGTFVNSHKLGPGEVVRLGDGDIIKVGATELLFKSLWLPPVASRAS